MKTPEQQAAEYYEVFEDGKWNKVSKAKALYIYTDLPHRTIDCNTGNIIESKIDTILTRAWDKGFEVG